MMEYDIQLIRHERILFPFMRRERASLRRSERLRYRKIMDMVERLSIPFRRIRCEYH